MLVTFFTPKSLHFYKVYVNISWTGEDIETQRGLLPLPGKHSSPVAEAGFELTSVSGAELSVT